MGPFLFQNLMEFAERHNSNVRFIKTSGNYGLSIATFEARLWDLRTGQSVGKIEFEKEVVQVQVFANHVYAIAGDAYYHYEYANGFNLLCRIEVGLHSSIDVHVENSSVQYIVCASGLYYRNGNSIVSVEQTTKKTITESSFSLRQDIPNSKSALILGYSNGDISIRMLNGDITRVQPIIQSPHLSAISAITINEYFLVTGSVDGTISIIDVVSFKPVRNFNFRSRNLTEEKKVKCIIVNSKSIICVQGNLIVIWEFKQPKQKSQRSRNKIKVPIQLPRNSNLDGDEIYEEVIDALEDIKKEKDRKVRTTQRIAKYNGDPNVHQMSEEDLVSYAMMLSRDNYAGAVSDPLSEQEMLDLALAISLSEANK
ncbi:hypothetical protein HDV01_003893 [Terramyces sp. JEL0728]|nr:hypothetical protein HDV01_003893 [Terramyces sp. JEL0728]